LSSSICGRRATSNGPLPASRSDSLVTPERSCEMDVNDSKASSSKSTSG
jgi:hypothetical protein